MHLVPFGYICAVESFHVLLPAASMDDEPLRRNKRQKKNVTYSDSIEAQQHASYERVAIVTRHGAVKHKRVAQNLAPQQPEAIEQEETLHQPVEDNGVNKEAGYVPDDVLAGVPIPRQRKPAKASHGKYRHKVACS